MAANEQETRRPYQHFEVDEVALYLKQVDLAIDWSDPQDFRQQVFGVLEEVRSKEDSLVRTRDGSQVYERLLSLVARGIKQASLEPTWTDDVIEVMQISLQSYRSMLRRVVREPFKMSTGKYATHVTQTVVELLPAFLEVESRLEVSDQTESKVAALFMRFFNYFRGAESESLTDVLFSDGGAKVFLACLLVLSGFRTQDVLLCKDLKKMGSRSIGRKRPTVVVPQDHYTPPDCFLDTFSLLLTELTEAVDLVHQDIWFSSAASAGFQGLILVLEGLAASPTVASQMQVLHDKLLNVEALQGLPWEGNYPPMDVCAAIYAGETPTSPVEDPDSALVVGFFDASCTSKPGSRLWDELLRCGSVANIHLFFSRYMRHRLSELCLHETGNYMVQSLLECAHFNEADLLAAIQKLPFRALVEENSPRHTAVLWKAADACRRLRVHHKEFVTRLLAALDVAETQYAESLWVSLLCLRPVAAVEEILLLMAEHKADNPERASRKLIPWDPAGISVMQSLLAFPNSTIQQITNSFGHFVKRANLLQQFSMDRSGAYFMEKLVSPSTPLQAKQLTKLVASLLPVVWSLAMNPHGGFVVTAMFRAADHADKKKIAEGLLGENNCNSEELRKRNFSVFRLCRLDEFLLQKEKWLQTQKTKSRTRQYFDKVLETATATVGVPEQTTSMTETTVAEIAEPEEADASLVAATLLLESGVASKKDRKRKKREADELICQLQKRAK